MILLSFCAVIGAYLLGSVPTGYLMVRVLQGQDIRTLGSGNIGATNVFRVAGKGPGVVVLLLDIFKGTAAVVGTRVFLQDPADSVLIASAMAVVAGHNWPVFLRFKGGKGVATSLGAVLGLVCVTPALASVLIAAVGVWAAVFLVTGYVSLASMTAAAVFGIGCVFNPSLTVAVKGTMLCLACWVLWRHRSNWARLRNGSESRFPWPWTR